MNDIRQRVEEAYNAELLNLQITVAGSEAEGRLAILLEGFTTKQQVDYVLEQFNKFMGGNIVQLRN